MKWLKKTFKKVGIILFKKTIKFLFFLFLILIATLFLITKFNSEYNEVKEIVEYKDTIVNVKKDINDIKKEIEEGRIKREEEYKSEMNKYSDMNKAIEKTINEIYGKEVSFDINFNSNFNDIYDEKDKLESIMNIHGFLFNDYLKIDDEYNNSNFGYKSDFNKEYDVNKKKINEINDYVVNEVFPYYKKIVEISTVEGKLKKYKSNKEYINLDKLVGGSNKKSRSLIEDKVELVNLDIKSEGKHFILHGSGVNYGKNEYNLSRDVKKIFNEKINEYLLVKEDLDDLEFVVVYDFYDEYIAKIDGKHVRTFIDDNVIYFIDYIYYEKDKSVMEESMMKEYKKALSEIEETIDFYILKNIVKANIKDVDLINKVELVIEER